MLARFFLIEKIIKRRLRIKLEKSIKGSQCNFRKGRNTIHLIFIIKQLSEEILRKDKGIDTYFIHLEKGFDWVRRRDIWRTLKKIGE